MEIFDSIFNRRSIRKYLQVPVEFDKVTRVLEAGTKAPTAGNLQDYRFILVTDKLVIKEVAEHCTEQFWIAEAPVLIVVCSDTERAEKYFGLRGQRLYSVQNAAAAIQNMLLAAHALGLGSCWVGSFDENYVSDKLGIPDDVRPQAIITLGYADEKPKDKTEEPLETMIYFNEYGSTVKNWNMYIRNYSEELSKFIEKTEPKIDKRVSGVKEHLRSLLNRTKQRPKTK